MYLCRMLVWFLWLIVGSTVVHATEPVDIFEANRRLGRGLNLGNYLEAPRDANWGVRIQDEHFQLIKEAGFSSIRLPVRWPDYAADTAPYRIQESFFRRVDHLLDAALKADLNVVLNIHHFEGLDKDPGAYQDKFVALWRQIALRYRDQPEGLYFELNNEPHEALNDRWNEILRLGLAALRETNPTRPAIVGPVSWNSIKSLPLLDLPDDPRLIVTVHMYNPHEFTHQGASWVSQRVRSIRNLQWGSDQELRALRDELQQAADWGRQHRRPIYLGEFGAYQAAPMDSRLRWTAAVARTAEELGMSWSYWEFAAGFGVYDPNSAKWREPLLRALIPSTEK